jgi:hypothetical protein
LSDAYVVLPDDSSFTGKKVDNTQVTVAGQDVQRQRVQLAGSNDTDLVEGDAANGLDVDVTRVTGTVTVGDGGATLSVDDGGGAISIDDGGGSITVDGVVSMSGAVATLGTKSVGGGLTAGTFLGVLPVQANASPPAWSENTNVLLSSDLNGALRVTGGTGSPSMTDNSAFTKNTDKVSPLGAIYDTETGLASGQVAAVRQTPLRALHVALRDGLNNNEFGASVDSGGRVSVAVNSISSSQTQRVMGRTAHDAAWSSQDLPNMVGGRASAAAPTAVTDADAVVSWFDLTGRLNTRAIIATPNGDSAMDDTNDALRVNIVAGAGSGGTAMTDDAAFTVATTSVTPAAGTYKSTRDAVDDGDAGCLAMSPKRGLYVSLETPNADSAMDDTNDAVKVTGEVAHDAADAGSPQKIGGMARQTNPTAVADADRVNAIFDDLGRQVVILNQVRDLEVHQQTTITSTTTETTIMSAVASTFLDLTSLDITNATATACTVTIKDSTSGTTQAIYALAANGGVAKTFMVPLKQTTVNNNWTATLSSGAVTVYFNVQAVKNI